MASKMEIKEPVDSSYEFHDEPNKLLSTRKAFARRRSISLTSEPEEYILAQLRRDASYSAHEEAKEEDIEEEVTLRRRVDEDEEDLVDHRPSSILVNENDDLLRLGDELHLRDLEREFEQEERRMRHQGPGSSSSLPTPGNKERYYSV